MNFGGNLLVVSLPLRHSQVLRGQVRHHSLRGEGALDNRVHDDGVRTEAPPRRTRDPCCDIRRAVLVGCAQHLHHSAAHAERDG